MKTLVFILVLANALFYAYSAGYFGRPDNPDAVRLEQQVAPEHIRIVSRDEAPALKTGEKPAAPTPEPAAAVPAPATAPAPVAEACLRWPQLNAEGTRLLTTRLNEKFPGYKLVKHTTPGEGNGWWVFIPPLGDKVAADKKAAELKQLGINDYFIVNEEGANRYAISLGVFSTEKGGEDRLAELRNKGVKSAKLSARPGKDSLTTVEARGPQTDRAAVIRLAAGAVPKTAPLDCR